MRRKHRQLKGPWVPISDRDRAKLRTLLSQAEDVKKLASNFIKAIERLQ